MAQNYTTLVKQLEDFIEKATIAELALAIVKFSAHIKGITPAMKDTNKTSDDDVAGMFTKILFSRKPTPAKIAWPKKEKDATKSIEYPLQWSGMLRSYDLDYDYWMTENGQTGHVMEDFFLFLKKFAKETQTIGNKFWSFIGGKDDAEAAELMFDNLAKMTKAPATNKALFFEAIAKSANISKLIYMFIAHYISAIAIMYYDAVFGYLVLNTYWVDGVIYGVKNINAVVPEVIIKNTAAGAPFETWKNAIPTFTQSSFDLILKVYSELETNTELNTTTVYKPNRKKQLYGQANSDIQMLVLINEKFNINCDTEFTTSPYRVELANMHYKKFKMTIPD